MKSVKLQGPASRMTSRDAGFLYLERPHALLHIGCVAVVEGRLRPDALARRIEARLPRMQRYAQRAVPAPLGLGHPAWEDDPDLDVQGHISQWTLPAPGGDHEVRELVATRLAQALDDLLDAEPRVRDVATPRLATEPTPDAATRIGRAVADTARRQFGIATSLLGALRGPSDVRDAMRRMRDAAFSAVQLAAGDLPSMPWNAPIGPRRRLAFARLPMDGVRPIRAARGGTVNDVVLCALAGGLHRYLRQSGVATRGLELTALVPVSLRNASEARSMGNRISAMLVPLAVDPLEEVPRLAATRALTERLKTRSAWTGIDALLGALDGMPPALVASA